METNENKTERQKIKIFGKNPAFLYTIIIIGFITVVFGGIWVIEYNCCPYHESYKRPAVKNCIDNYTAKATQCFGEVYIPKMSLSDDRIFIRKFKDIPGPSSIQYGIWLNNSEKQGELKTKLIALVQLPPSMPNLTKQEIVDMAKNGELLCGGVVNETKYHNYSWKDLSNDTQEKLQNLSNNKDFGNPVEKKHSKGILSVTKIYDIPSRCSEQSVISYFVESPYGFKNEKILVQGDIANYKTDTPYIYGGIN